MIELLPMSEDDLPLTERFLMSPAMMEFLGGAQSREQARVAHQRFLDTAAARTGQMFKIVVQPEAAAAGSVGYWDKTWQGQSVYETGWSVFPEYQRRGLAREATAMVVERARREGKHRFLHAFPNVSNVASNAICRTLGFVLLGASEFEYPAGHFMMCNDWRLDLQADPPGST